MHPRCSVNSVGVEHWIYTGLAPTRYSAIQSQCLFVCLNEDQYQRHTACGNAHFKVQACVETWRSGTEPCQPVAHRSQPPQIPHTRSSSAVATAALPLWGMPMSDMESTCYVLQVKDCPLATMCERVPKIMTEPSQNSNWSPWRRLLLFPLPHTRPRESNRMSTS